MPGRDVLTGKTIASVEFSTEREWRGHTLPSDLILVMTDGTEFRLNVFAKYCDTLNIEMSLFDGDNMLWDMEL